MRITSTTTNPNFTAKLKKNEDVEKLINRMDETQVHRLKDTLDSLDKTNKDDILELKSHIGASFIGHLNYYYSLTNTKDKSLSLRINSNNVSDVINTLERVANSKTEEHDKVFGIKRNKEIFDMLA